MCRSCDQSAKEYLFPLSLTELSLHPGRYCDAQSCQWLRIIQVMKKEMPRCSSKGDDEKGKGGVDIDNLGLDKKKKRKKTFSDLVGKINLFLRPSW